MLVAGAGVVGMACARALQRAGYRVAVADPAAPGSVCSFGNAGVMAADHVLPMARPEILRRVPAMLLDRNGPLYLKASRLPGLLPWFARFALACRPARVQRGTAAIAALTGRAVAAWEAELDASRGRDLLLARGMYAVYRTSEAFQRDAAERRVAQSLGVVWEAFDGAELRRREPALADHLSHGVYFPQVAHVLDPQAVVQRLATAFDAAGGVRIEQPVLDLSCEPHQVLVRLADGRLRARYVVVAAGLGSRDLCAALGVRVPLVAEMGYHLVMPEPQPRLQAPVAAAEHGFIVTPMSGALRVAGTVEFARREAAPAWRRADMLHPLSAALFRDPLPPASGRWRGSRPTLPDFLPAIGPLPGHPRVLAAFGHQHIGLTTAAITGSMVCALVQGRPAQPDPAPFLPGRFAGGA